MKDTEYNLTEEQFMVLDSIDKLSYEYQQFCHDNNFEQLSADELARYDNLKQWQYNYIYNFINRWEGTMEELNKQ